MCTVMFAKVEYEVSTPEDFDFLGYLFSAYDEAVEQSGIEALGFRHRGFRV